MSAPPLMQKDLGQPPPYTETAPPYPMAPGYPPAPGYGPGPGYPPPGPGYPQGPPVPPPGCYPPPPVTQQPTTIVYTANTLGPGPSRFYCTNCQREVLTNVSYESGLFTWLLVALICILGGPLCCCLIPLCCPPCKDVDHFCPVCNRLLGTHSRI
ncbi:unnamed protein product [Hymenolepis diminuta]|uniref:LITAF domain-containing protein n=1 Tax=Hymenolepis diminuta TaxID=6216 RepID=A0A564YEQ8_HYMDI|nr:unnamed protein product [Hymenolepis diminuta]